MHTCILLAANFFSPFLPRSLMCCLAYVPPPHSFCSALRGQITCICNRVVVVTLSHIKSHNIIKSVVADRTGPSHSGVGVFLFGSL